MFFFKMQPAFCSDFVVLVLCDLKLDHVPCCNMVICFVSAFSIDDHVTCSNRMMICLVRFDFV